MLVLDTCALIFDALQPEKLSSRARQSIQRAEEANRLVCCDISLWEIAMLISKKRLDPATDCKTFLEVMLASRKLNIMPITPEIAALSSLNEGFPHLDPADRIIAATTIYYKGKLVTCDKKLASVPGLFIIW
jgi:PIN domain nuclease of toxin-antitoxin system